MATKDFKRKLTAILSADVAGYSRLMGEDEAQTVKTITAYREVMSELIKQHRGRVIDSPGDNLLAEFASVVDAVQCAVAVQKEFHARNAELPENRRMVFRIGINLGDVIQEGERIYGDGVNIAARLESLADPGGICVSKTAFDQIETKLPLGYEYLGEQTVKNIAKPVGAYRVLMEPRVTVAGEKEKVKLVPLWRRKAILAGGVAFVVVVIAALIWNFYFRVPPMEVASVERMAFPLPEEPSIAVLPFVNMSDDPKQEYFSDGIAEEIITALSKTSKLFVIARTSSFKYKGKEIDVRTVGRELGVRYVLEGSVRKSGDTVRITAQLVDTKTGNHVWAHRYDRDLKDIFALQDEITMKIITALQVKLTEGEQVRIWGKQPRNLDIYLKGMEANSLWAEGKKESHIRYGQVARDIVDMEPESVMGNRLLAWHYWYLASIGKSPKESLLHAFKLCKKALSLDESDPFSHSLLGSIYLFMRQYEKAIAHGKRSVELQPNGANVHGLLGMTLSFADRPDEAISHLTHAIRLNPFAPYWCFYRLGQSYMQKGEYEEALTAYKKAVQRAPDAFATHAHLAVLYVLLDRQEDARAAAKKVLEQMPNFSGEKQAKAMPFKNQDHRKLFFEAWQKAGLK
jgi:adenylate cyclase